VHRKGIAEEDVEGTASVDEHLFELYVPDDRIQNEGETPWLRNIGPLVSSAERNGLVQPVLILGVGKCHTPKFLFWNVP
jgi:hypothetical protein